MNTENEQGYEPGQTPQQLVEEKNDQTIMSHHFAGFWIRVWAYLLDLVVIQSVYSILVRPIIRALEIEGWSWSFITAEGLLYSIIFYLYFILLTKFLGQTIGKMAFGIKVIRDNGKKLTWQDVIIREWVGRYISVTLNITYLIVAFVPKKKGLHDIFADTLVIHVDTYRIVKTPSLPAAN